MPDFTLPGYTFHRPQPHTWSLGNKDGVLVSINMETGETTFGEHYTPDEAQIFQLNHRWKFAN
jgi:hypothetical protein